MQAVLASGMEELERWESSYSALLGRVGGLESMYYSLDCIRASFDTFKTLGASLFFILMVDSDAVVAVLPFQLVRDSAFGVRRTIMFWGALDIYARNAHQRILADGDRPDAIAAAVSFLSRELRAQWDLILFHWISMEDDNFKHFMSAFPGSRLEPCGGYFYWYDARVDLDHHLGASRLGNMRRRMRRMEKDHGQVEFGVKEYISETDLHDIASMHTARRVHLHNEGAFFTDPDQHAYVRRLVGLWNRRRCLRYYTLRAGGKLVAIDVTYHADDVAYGFIISFDNNYAKYAPSRYLSYKSYRHEIEHCGSVRIESGCDSDADDLKLDYSTHKAELHDFEATNDRLRSRCILVLIRWQFRLRQRFG